MHAILEFLKRQRTIIQRARQPEPVLHQVLFARPVAVIHALQLRHRLMALVDEHQGVRRQIIEQRRRRLARQPPRKMPRVILDAVAVADLLDHLQIEHGALPDALRLDALALFLQLAVPPLQLVLRCCAARCCASLGHHIVRLRIDRQPQIGLLHLAGQRIDLLQGLDFIAPQLDAIAISS